MNRFTLWTSEPPVVKILTFLQFSTNSPHPYHPSAIYNISG
jgi:hypothetical protein